MNSLTGSLKNIGLIKAGLAAVLAVVLAGALVHAASDQLKAARMTNSTLASQIDDKVGELETALGIILGITLDTNVSAIFSIGSTGLITVQYDLTLPDSTALTMGTGGDVDIEYDGTDLLINPAVVGSGDVVITGGSVELEDSESVTLGTGKDATVLYDGTDVVINPRVVGSGGVKLDAGTLFIKEQADADTDKAAYGQIWVNTATPNTLFFTDDAGTDTQLGAAGGTDMTAHAVTMGGGTAGTDIVWTFDGENNDGVFSWMEDEDYFRLSDNIQLLDNVGIIFGNGSDMTFQSTGANVIVSGSGQLSLDDTQLEVRKDSTTVILVDRGVNDGTLISLKQATSEEGRIDVSGTTVGYQTFMGAHWAQFLGPVPQVEFGHVVVATGDIIPLRTAQQNRGPYDIAKLAMVKMSSSRGQRAIYGVYRHLEKDSEMNSVSFDRKGNPVASIAALGLFVVRVTDTAGNIANGDYLQTSPRAGEAEKQVDGSMVYDPHLMDKTVAKALVNVDWETVSVDPTLGYKWKLIPATLHSG